MKPNTKKCGKCDLIKNITEFAKSQITKDKHSYQCKECVNKYAKKYRANGKLKRICPICNKEFFTVVERVRFCSRKCSDKFCVGVNATNWKGDKVGYQGVHQWVTRVLGKPNYCEHCKSTKKGYYEWSNISNKYKRDVTDWQRLCARCHYDFDLRLRKVITVKCLQCNKKIKTISTLRKYCNTNCNMRHWRYLKKLKKLK